MAEFNKNLWAPWRMEYIHTLGDETEPGGCFLCKYAQEPVADADHHVVWRGLTCMTVFNRFPYTNGHLLIAPFAHKAELSDLEDSALDELIRQVRDAQRLLRDVTACQGLNVGMNFGRCAGAGVPDHLHVHILPRWEGDTNFMPVLADVHVIPQSIQALYDKMREAAPRLGLPQVVGQQNP